MDIKYFDNKIYATTFYVINETVGLFVSNDKGITWNKIGPSFSPTKVNRDSHTIYLGGEHYGLWISQDEGQTWVQKMGIGGDGTRVTAIESSEDVTFVSLQNKVYKTTDNGNTWQEIPFLLNKSITVYSINNNEVLAGSSGGLGLFLSLDKGNTWSWVSSFGRYYIYSLTYFDNKYYVGRINPLTQKHTIYSTRDLGNTWVDLNPDSYFPDTVLSLGAIISDQPYLLTLIAGNGVYKYEIKNDQIPNFPFLDIPWSYTNKNELLDNITSFFDHSYPLLGYNYFTEPENEKLTTLNFLGIKNTEPTIYYSSHSGIDFGLKYGTKIHSPASGYATYYYCKDCGNTIKIDHQNGYQTIYMHLQEDSLFTKNDKKWVNKGDIIGKVGLTGRSTGPHLHFEVLFDKNGDGIFNDDFPSGRVDPFGWNDLNKNGSDPWRYFSWTDSLGNHEGSESKYLWENQNTSLSKLVHSNSSSQDLSLIIDNKQINFQESIDFFTSKIYSHYQPTPSSYSTIYKYIKNTSFILEAFDQLGNIIKNFDEDITISIDMDSINLSNINIGTLKLNFWNEITNLWESIPTFFNEQENKVTAAVNHLSWFAVFGEKIDTQPPKTQILVSGTQINGWYIDFPLVNLSCYNNEICDIENIFYSIDNGYTWEKYTEPFYIQKDGVTDLIFKSQDINENMESENSYVIQTNILEEKIEKLTIKNSKFSIGE